MSKFAGRAVRADVSYWHQRHGRRLPKPVKRGAADAVHRLYNEKTALKYDGKDHIWRMAAVVELVRPASVSDCRTLCSST